MKCLIFGKPSDVLKESSNRVNGHGVGANIKLTRREIIGIEIYQEVKNNKKNIENKLAKIIKA